MKKYPPRTIDELGRIPLPMDARKKLNITDHDSLSLTAVSTLLIVQKVNDETKDNCIIRIIDELGRIVLPGELRQEMKWGLQHEIEVYQTDNLMILKSKDKSESKSTKQKWPFNNQKPSKNQPQKK